MQTTTIAHTHKKESLFSEIALPATDILLVRKWLMEYDVEHDREQNYYHLQRVSVYFKRMFSLSSTNTMFYFKRCGLILSAKPTKTLKLQFCSDDLPTNWLLTKILTLFDICTHKKVAEKMCRIAMKLIVNTSSTIKTWLLFSVAEILFLYPYDACSCDWFGQNDSCKMPWNRYYNIHPCSWYKYLYIFLKIWFDVTGHRHRHVKH